MRRSIVFGVAFTTSLSQVVKATNVPTLQVLSGRCVVTQLLSESRPAGAPRAYAFFRPEHQSGPVTRSQTSMASTAF
ncbi:hypothetical protein ACWGI8_41475, partial [Streptomyces sp. NPDC054841]